MATVQAGVLSTGAVPSSVIWKPPTPPGPGSTLRGFTFATVMPDAARPLRFSRTICAAGRKPSFARLRRLWFAPRDAPSVGGMCQRVCVPPGPLKLPRLIMSHGPVAERCGITLNGLL